MESTSAASSFLTETGYTWKESICNVMLQLLSQAGNLYEGVTSR